MPENDAPKPPEKPAGSHEPAKPPPAPPSEAIKPVHPPYSTYSEDEAGIEIRTPVGKKK